MEKITSFIIMGGVKRKQQKVDWSGLDIALVF